jgi:hypothetical protein
VHVAIVGMVILVAGLLPLGAAVHLTSVTDLYKLEIDFVEVLVVTVQMFEIKLVFCRTFELVDALIEWV